MPEVLEKHPNPSVGKKGQENMYFSLFGFRQPCKTEPLCESHSVEQIFSRCFEKFLALLILCGPSQKMQLAGLQLAGECNFILSVKML